MVLYPTIYVQSSRPPPNDTNQYRIAARARSVRNPGLHSLSAPRGRSQQWKAIDATVLLSRELALHCTVLGT